MNIFEILIKNVTIGLIEKLNFSPGCFFIKSIYVFIESIFISTICDILQSKLILALVLFLNDIRKS